MFKITEANRKWWILAAMTSTISMIFIDITVLPVALPTIQKHLHFSDLALQWIVNCYTLTLTVLVLAGGRLSDMFGPKKIFCYGAALFAVASALCGLSYSDWWFILSRILQGVGGALLLPSTATITLSAFPLKERGKAMGISISVGSVFLSIGPFIGGLLTEYLSWRYVFWINLPIAAIGLILALYSVPRSEKKHEKFDFLGFWTMSIGITALVVALMQAKDWGWTSPITLALFSIGFLLIFLLIVLDRKVEHHFIDFKLFKNRNFSGCVFSMFCTQFIIMITVFWVIYFQTGLGYSPAKSGMLNLLANIPMIFVAPIGGHLLDRYGPRLPIAIGYLLVIGSFVWFLQVFHLKSMPMLLSAIIPFGCGIPLIFSPCFTAALSEISEHKRGSTAGLVTTIRQSGATIGLAIFGALFLYFQHGRFSSALSQNAETQNLDSNQFEGLLAKAEPAVQALGTYSASIQDYIVSSNMAAYVSAFSKINLFAAVVAVVALIVSLLTIKRHLAPPHEKKPAVLE